MDVDVVGRYQSYFSFTPDLFPYDEIQDRRAKLTDTLIFDILLKTGGIADPYRLYPPRDEEGLTNLLYAIEGTSYDALKKECLVYYLLKWAGDEKATSFLRERRLLPQFSALSDAYWCIDTGKDLSVRLFPVESCPAPDRSPSARLARCPTRG
jgi:hypothetical protein